MGRRRPFRERVPLVLLAALAACWSCAPHSGRAPSLALTARMPASGSVPVQQASALRSDLIGDEKRIQQLEQELAERDRRIAAVQTQIEAAGGGTTASQSAPSAAAPPAPGSPPAPPADGFGASVAAAAATHEVQPPAADLPAPGVPAAPAAAGPPGPQVAPEQRLADLQKRIVKLQQQLALEVKRRQDVEGEMNRLLQETSAGPFEHADNVVEKHLREELDRTRKEVTELRSTLLTERRDRADLERRFAALQAEAQAAASAAPRTGVPSEEVEALKERQRRVLASIEQDLEASRRREADLRQTVEQSQGANGPSLADEVTTLRSENSALQTRLDDEHQHNHDLSAKLQLATRVTDLIFKMQTAGARPAAAIPAAAR